MSSVVRTASEVAKLPWVARLRRALERAWDRIDAMSLRFQGRVDTPSWDRGLPYAFAALHAAALITATLARYHSLLHGRGTAKFAQATWQIGEGLQPTTTLSDGSVIAEQGSLILYPLGLITAILPRIETLLVLQALALSLAMIPLWRLARRHGRLGIGATTVVIVVYALYAAVHYMNASDFAPAVLAVPALAWAVLYGFDERDYAMLGAIVFALCCRADLGLAISGLGVLLWLEKRRSPARLAMLVGIGWFLVSIYGLQPWLADGSYGFLTPYAEFGATPLRALWGIISNPWRFLSIVGTIENFRVVVLLLAPVLFLPLTAPRFVMPAVPLYVLYMGANVEPGLRAESAQMVPITVFVFVATIFALQRAGRTLVKQVRVERRILLALLLTGLVFFVRDAPMSPYARPWEWGERDSIDEARIAALDQLPDEDVPIRASATLLPLLSERLAIYELDTTRESDDETLDEIIDDAVRRVDWIVVDRNAESLTAEEVNVVRGRLITVGWQQVDRNDEAGIDVYEFTGIVLSDELTTLETDDDSGADDEEDSGDGG